MCITALGCLVVTGCHAVPTINGAANIHPLPPIGSGMPHELSKVVLPPYVIEPPDILFIEAVNAVPKSPYRLKTLDVLSIQVAGTLPDAPISGAFPIEPGGIVNLGIPYGGVRVAGLTADEARTAIEMHLRNFLREPQVAVALVELGGMQQVGGEYLVGPDGTVTLGSYGSVSVVGKTLEQAKLAIEQHISRFLENPVISLSVSAFNSKVYYIP
jgi:polysaccharide export outer membrane protein